jgi:hypothetical protein
MAVTNCSILAKTAEHPDGYCRLARLAERRKFGALLKMLRAGLI